MAEQIPKWERQLLEREALFDALRHVSGANLAAFLKDLDERVRQLEHDAEQRRWAEMGDDL